MTTTTDTGKIETSPPTNEKGPDSNRVFLFLLVQGGFLGISPMAGGFRYEMWSMMDSSLLISAIGVTALALIFDEVHAKRRALKVGVVLYILGVFDMSINVLLSGWIGWLKNPID